MYQLKNVNWNHLPFVPNVMTDFPLWIQQAAGNGFELSPGGKGPDIKFKASIAQLPTEIVQIM